MQEIRVVVFYCGVCNFVFVASCVFLRMKWSKEKITLPEQIAFVVGSKSLHKFSFDLHNSPVKELLVKVRLFQFTSENKVAGSWTPFLITPPLMSIIPISFLLRPQWGCSIMQLAHLQIFNFQGLIDEFNVGKMNLKFKYWNVWYKIIICS